MTSYTNPADVDRFRVALKFSLWTWALYWPGGGILMLTGGLDPISILVVLGSFASFVMLVLMGGLRTTSSRTMKQLLLERPIYFIAAVALLALMAPLIAPLTSAALVVFATIYLAGMIYALVCLVQVYKGQNQPLVASGLDQTFVAMGIAVLAAFLVFADAWVTVFGAEPFSGPAFTVAVANWINLLYPPLIMLGARGLREPLRKPSLRLGNEDEDAPTAAQS